MIPLDTYIFHVLSLQEHVRIMIRSDNMYVRGRGLALYEDVKVLVDDLKTEGYIE